MSTPRARFLEAKAKWFNITQSSSSSSTNLPTPKDKLPKPLAPSAFELFESKQHNTNPHHQLDNLKILKKVDEEGISSKVYKGLLGKTIVAVKGNWLYLKSSYDLCSAPQRMGSRVSIRSFHVY